MKLKPVLIVGAILLGGFGIGLYQLNMYGYFAPRYEEVRRKTFENTKSYNQGMQQELQSYFLEYQKSDEDGKQAIAAVISHQYADYPTQRLPLHLRNFVESILNPTTF